MTTLKPLALAGLLFLSPAPAAAQARLAAVAAPLGCLSTVKGWPSFLAGERAIFLCGGAPNAEGPAACFGGARAWPLSLSEERAALLCRGAAKADAPVGCLSKARAWPHGLNESKAVSLCRGARTAEEPVTCFGEARGRGLDVEEAVELCGHFGPRSN